MIRKMTLREANCKVEELENDYNYYLNEKESLLSIVLPKSSDIRDEQVDGGKRINLLEKYAETEDIQKLDATLDYIFKKKENLLNWIENELKILNKYQKIEQEIVYYKEVDNRNLTWIEISVLVHYSVSQCKKIYSKYKKKRDIH